MKFPLKFEPETQTQKARIIDADGIVVAFLSADKSLWNKDTHPLKQLFDITQGVTHEN